MGIEEEAEKHLDLEQRVTELENLLKQTQDALLKLEGRCAPLYSVDIDLLAREFWSLRLKFNGNKHFDSLIRKYNASKLDIYNSAARHLEMSLNIACGKMTLADDPLEIGRNWYTEVKSYTEKLGIFDEFIESPETIFPRPKQEDGI